MGGTYYSLSENRVCSAAVISISSLFSFQPQRQLEVKEAQTTNKSGNTENPNTTMSNNKHYNYKAP